MSTALQSPFNPPSMGAFTTATSLTLSETVPAATPTTYALPAFTAGYNGLVVENVSGSNTYVALANSSPVPVGTPDLVSGCTVITGGTCYVFRGRANMAYVGIYAPGGGVVNFAAANQVF